MPEKLKTYTLNTKNNELKKEPSGWMINGDQLKVTKLSEDKYEITFMTEKSTHLKKDHIRGYTVKEIARALNIEIKKNAVDFPHKTLSNKNSLKVKVLGCSSPNKNSKSGFYVFTENSFTQATSLNTKQIEENADKTYYLFDPKLSQVKSDQPYMTLSQTVGEATHSWHIYVNHASYTAPDFTKVW